MAGQHYYTWCPKEVGCEGLTGFQTRAKSDSITADVERRIKNYCERYELPRSLDYLKSKSASLAQADLALAPVAVHFYPISENLHGLTRICLHPRQGGLGGNFFAHTLVLSSEELRQAEYNPFVVLRSAGFQDNENGVGKKLPDLRELPIIRNSLPPLVSSGEAREAVELTLRALTMKREDRRRIVLLPEEIDHAAAIIENALLQLPPQARASVAFSTYAPNPYEVFGRSSAEFMPHLILGTIPKEEGGKFALEQHEYQDFFIVNPAGRSSESTCACPAYVQLALNSSVSSDRSKLIAAQQMISTLKLESSPEEWDLAIQVAPLASSTADLRDEEWQTIANTLVSSCGASAEQARSALSLLWAKAGSAIAGMSGATLEIISSASERLLRIAGVNRKREWLSISIIALAAALVAGGGVYAFITRPADPVASEGTAQARTREPAVNSPAAILDKIQQGLAIPGVSASREGDFVKVTFATGLFGNDAALSPDASATLSEIRRKLQGLNADNKIRIDVEGHTDQIPVRKNPRYSSNDDLGFWRARAVVKFLRSDAQLPADMFHASSAGSDQAHAKRSPAEPGKRTVVLRISPRS